MLTVREQKLFAIGGFLNCGCFKCWQIFTKNSKYIKKS